MRSKNCLDKLSLSKEDARLLHNSDSRHGIYSVFGILGRVVQQTTAIRRLKTKNDQPRTVTSKYTILYESEEEGGYSGRCLELPAAISQGETLEELKRNMTEAVELVLEHYQEISKGKQSMQIITNVA